MNVECGMDDIDLLITQIREAGDRLWIAGAQPEEAIAELERALGIPLPPSYRAFLTRFGGLAIVNSSISGIVNAKPLARGTGWLYGDTLRFRRDFGLPEHLLVIQPDEDAPYCLDSSAKMPDGEFPLVCYELHSRHVSRMAESFGEWLVEWLRLRAESDIEQ
jgi:hypothetical protein